MADNKAEYIIESSYNPKGAQEAARSIGGLADSTNDSALKFSIFNNAIDMGADLLIGLGQAAAEAVGEMISLGSDSRETASLLNNALGPAAESFNEQIAEIAENTRRSSFELTQGSASIIAMTRSMGFGQETAANFGATVAQVGADFSSYFNVEQTQFFEDFQAALAGSSETMTKYGIDVRETTLQQAALSSGMIESIDQYDRQIRAQVLLSEVQRQGADAYNDAAETAEGYANSMKGLEALSVDTKEQLGLMIVEGLEPAANIMYELAKDAQPAVIEGFADIVDAVEEYGLVLSQSSGYLDDTIKLWASFAGITSGSVDSIKEAAFSYEAVANILTGGLYQGFSAANEAIREQGDALQEAEIAATNYASYGTDMLALQEMSAEAAREQASAIEEVAIVNEDFAAATDHIASIIYDEELAFRGAQIAAELHADALAADAKASEEAAKAAEEAAKKRIQTENKALSTSESLYADLYEAQEQLKQSQGEYVQVYSDSSDEIARISSQLAGDLDADQKKAYQDILATVEEGSSEWLGAYQALQNDLTDSQRQALIAQQAELQNTEGGWQTVYTGDAAAAEEAQAAIEAANAAIGQSYRTAAFEATVAQNGFNESTAQLAVNLGIMTEEEADAKLKFVETSAAISELTSNVDYLNASATDQAEAAQLLALGYTTSSEEALALSQTISGNLSSSLIESTELSAAQIALLDAMTGSHKAEVDVSVIGLEALREADALRRNLQTSQQSARAQLAENDYAESIGGAL